MDFVPTTFEPLFSHSSVTFRSCAREQGRHTLGFVFHEVVDFGLAQDGQGGLSGLISAVTYNCSVEGRYFESLELGVSECALLRALSCVPYRSC